MRVILFDLDVHKRRRPFPNLALMKLSSYHKAKGDEVLLNFPLAGADIMYASCVFSWNNKRGIGLPPDTILGGAGVSINSSLPTEVEHTKPDYELYHGIDFSLGFTSRGCCRRCPWCIVPMKEGMIQQWARIYEFWDRRHRKIKILDNNMLAAPNWKETLEDIIAEGLEADLNQGLDIRQLDNDKIRLLKEIKAKSLRFSFDDIAYERAVREGIRALTDAGIPSRRLFFYVLYGFEVDDHVIERMKILYELNVDVFPMAYRGPDGKEPNRSVIFHDTILWHGPYQNKLKFLRLVGRLP